MNEFIEKLIGRLEEIKSDNFASAVLNEPYSMGICHTIEKSIEIVNQLAEECKSSIPITHYDLIVKFIESEIERTSSFAEHDTQINIMNYVQQLQEQNNNGWIPCSDRLPETYENVSICQSDGYVNVGWYSLNEFKDMNSILYKDVIAWQPLPAPYQPKGE